MAIKAQKTKLEIGTGSGGAKTITGVTLGKITKITAVGHGLANGDRVAFASIVGTTELNGQTATVKHVDTDSFFVEIDSTGYTAYTSGGTATPVTFTQVLGLKGFKKADGKTTEIDVTEFDSDAKEIEAGLADSGSVDAEVNYLTADAGQVAMRAAKADGSTKAFRLTLRNGTSNAVRTFTFNGVVTEFPFEGKVDGVVTGNASIRISGVVTEA